jgi:uncharacterized protein
MTASFGSTHIATLLAELHSLFASLSVVYVFGSASQNQMHSESDIDVAIDIGRELTSGERWHATQVLAVCLMRDVDLIDFRVASDVLRHQILTTGRRLFARNDAAQSSYEAAVLSEYFDFIAQRTPLMQDIAARGYVYAR